MRHFSTFSSSFTSDALGFFHFKFFFSSKKGNHCIPSAAYTKLSNKNSRRSSQHKQSFDRLEFFPSSHKAKVFHFHPPPKRILICHVQFHVSIYGHVLMIQLFSSSVSNLYDNSIIIRFVFVFLRVIYQIFPAPFYCNHNLTSVKKL